MDRQTGGAAFVTLSLARALSSALLDAAADVAGSWLGMWAQLSRAATMPAGDVLTWASALFLLGLGAFIVATIALLFAARGLGRRLDRIIRLLESDRKK